MSDKATQIFNSYVHNTRVYCVSGVITTNSCGCCGFYTGFSQTPKGVEVIVSDAPVPKLSTRKTVQHETVQLDNGKWLSCQFFIPDNYDDAVNHYPYTNDPSLPSYLEDKLGVMVISSLSGYDIKRIHYTELDSMYIPRTKAATFDESPLDIILKEKKGWQLLAVTLRSYGDWIDKYIGRIS